MCYCGLQFFPQGIRGPRGSPGKPGLQGRIVSQSNRDDKEIKRDYKVIHCFNLFCDILALSRMVYIHHDSWCNHSEGTSNDLTTQGYFGRITAQLALAPLKPLLFLLAAFF